jgi:hypothetical protein
MRVMSEPKTAANHAAFIALSEAYYHCDTLRSCVHRYPDDTRRTTKRWRHVALPFLRTARNGAPWELRHVSCQQMWQNNQENLKSSTML